MLFRAPFFCCEDKRRTGRSCGNPLRERNAAAARAVGEKRGGLDEHPKSTSFRLNYNSSSVDVPTSCSSGAAQLGRGGKGGAPT